MQKEVAMKSIKRTVLGTDEQVEFVETEKWILPQMHEEVLQRSHWTRNHPSGKRETLIDSVPDQNISIAVKVEDGVHGWCSEEMSELSQDQEESDWNCMNHREIVLELGME